jgi:hypothetical protein
MDKKPDEKDFFDYVNPFTSRYIKPITDWIFKSRAHAIMLAIILISIFIIINLISDVVKDVLIISFLMLIGGISKIYQRFFKVQLGIEFIMLATVISGYVYGPFVGAIVGFFTFALATYFSGFFSHTLVISFIMITLVGAAAALFSNTSIKTAGITLTLIYNLLFIPIYIGWFRGRVTRIFMFSITHILWNVWVFSTIAPFIMTLIS